jgi:hypothetical protein
MSEIHFQPVPLQDPISQHLGSHPASCTNPADHACADRHDTKQKAIHFLAPPEAHMQARMAALASQLPFKAYMARLMLSAKPIQANKPIQAARPIQASTPIQASKPIQADPIGTHSEKSLLVPNSGDASLVPASSIAISNYPCKQEHAAQ